MVKGSDEEKLTESGRTTVSMSSKLFADFGLGVAEPLFPVLYFGAAFGFSICKVLIPSFNTVSREVKLPFCAKGFLDFMSKCFSISCLFSENVKMNKELLKITEEISTLNIAPRGN